MNKICSCAFQRMGLHEPAEDDIKFYVAFLCLLHARKILRCYLALKLSSVWATPLFTLANKRGQACIVLYRSNTRNMSSNPTLRVDVHLSFCVDFLLFGQAWQLQLLSTRRPTECPQTSFEKPRKRGNLCLFGQQHSVYNYCSLLWIKTLVLPTFIGICYFRSKLAQKPYSPSQRYQSLLLSSGRHSLGVQFITSLQSNLCKALTNRAQQTILPLVTQLTRPPKA